LQKVAGKLSDTMQPEMAVTAVVTAAVFSPRARRVICRGLVYGMAGALLAGDAIASFWPLRSSCQSADSKCCGLASSPCQAKWTAGEALRLLTPYYLVLTLKTCSCPGVTDEGRVTLFMVFPACSATSV